MIEVRLSFKVVLGLAVVFLAAVVVLNLTSDNVEATTYYWDNGGGDGKASTAANWYPDLPSPAGWTSVDNVTWGAVSVANCAFDSANVVYSFNILANYSGTITQGSNDINIGAGGYSQAGGVFTGDSAKLLICYGNLIRTAGTITNDVLNVQMIGTGKTYTSNARPYSIRITGSITHTAGNFDALTVDSGATFIIAVGGTMILGLPGTSTGSFINDGTISGGTITIMGYGLSPVYVRSASGCTNNFMFIQVDPSNAVCKLSGVLAGIGTVSVTANEVGYTMTLDLNGKSLSCGPLTAGARGIIKSTVAGARIDASSVIVQMSGHLYGQNIVGIVYSDPVLSVKNPSLYSYSALSNLTVKTWSKDSGNATWLSVGSANGTVWGTPPTVESVSFYMMNLKLVDAQSDPFWQNWTVWIYPPFVITSAFVDSFEWVSNIFTDQFYVYAVTANEAVDSWNVSTAWVWSYDPSVTCLMIGSDGQLRSLPVNGTMLGTYFVNISATNENGTVWQNGSVVVSMYVSPVEQMTVPLVFLLFCAGLSFVCYVKRVPLIVLILFLVELLGVVAMINDFGDYWYIPLGLALVTGVLLVQSLRRD